MGFACDYCHYDMAMLFVSSGVFHKEVMSTMVHEFLHYLMYTLYDNRALPFSRDDIDRRDFYFKVNEASKKASKAIENKNLTQSQIKIKA